MTFDLRSQQNKIGNIISLITYIKEGTHIIRKGRVIKWVLRQMTITGGEGMQIKKLYLKY